MNKFKHYRGLLIGREAAFRLVQEQMYKNITQVVVPMLSTGGVMGDVLGSGIISDENLKVVYGSTSGKIKIKPGMAINVGSPHYNTEIIVLTEELELTLNSYLTEHSGAAYVYIDYSAAAAASGYETYKPGQVPGASHIYLLENDSYSVSIQTDTEGNYGLLLAKIYVQYSSPNHTLVLSADKEGDLNMSSVRPYLDTDDTGTIVTTGIGAFTLSPITEILVGNELITVDGYTNPNFSATARGVSGSNIGFHRNGEDIVVSPIVDMRQTNAARMDRGNTQFEELIQRGIINYNEGGGDRLINTSKIADVPNAPTLLESNIRLVWLNQNNGVADINSVAGDVVKEAKSADGRVKYLSSEINAIRRSIIDASDAGEIASLQERLSELQVSLTETNSEKNDLMAQVTEINKQLTPATKKYVAIMLINQPTLVDSEQIIQYEAEVTYMAKGASGVVDRQVVKSYYYTQELRPDSIGAYGDKVYTYDTMPEEEYRKIAISIQRGEKISVRARSITEQRMVSVWSSPITYSFDSINDSEIKLGIEIEELLNSAASTAMSSTVSAETLDWIRNIHSEFLNGLVEVRSVYAEFEAMQSNIDSLTSRVTGLEASISNLQGSHTALVAQVNTTQASLD